MAHQVLASFRDGAAILALLSFLPIIAHAQSIRGTVRDSGGRGLDAVTVELSGTGISTTTNAVGQYALQPRAGTYAISYRRLGSAPALRQVHLRATDSLTIDIVLLTVNVQQLDTVLVQTRKPRGVGREAFEERRALGFGKFIDSTELRRSEGRRLHELLREKGSVVMQRSLGVYYGYHAVNPTKYVIGPDGKPQVRCYMTIIQDGVTLYRAGSDMPPVDLSRDIQVANLDAIEVYRSTGQIPVEFAGRGADCGVIVLWTRRRR